MSEFDNFIYELGALVFFLIVVGLIGFLIVYYGGRQPNGKRWYEN